MSFSVSYVYKIIDEFTPKLREIEKATNEFNRSVGSLQTKLGGLNEQLKNVAAGAIDTSKSLKEMNNTAAQTALKAKSKIEGGLKGIATKLENFSTSASSVASSIGAGLGLKKVIGDAIDFQSTVTDMRKVMDFANEKELKQFQDNLYGVGKALALSKTDMNKLAASASRLGIEKGDIGEFAKLASDITIAFEGMTLDAATKNLADMRTKLGLSQEELRKTIDTVNYLDDKTNATGTGMLDIMSRLTGIFKAMHVPPEVAASFAAVAQQIAPQGNPELAASGLKMFVQGLLDVKKVSPEISAALNKDFKGTIIKVLAKLKQMPEEIRNIKIVEIFGEYAAPFIMTLVNSQELLNNTLAIGADKLNAYGSMQKEVNKRKEDAAFKLQNLKARFTDLAITIGEKSLPALSKIADALSEVVDSMSKFADQNPELSKFLVIALAMTTAAAPFALAASVLANGISAISSALMFLVATPLGATISGIALLAYGIYYAYQKSEQFRASITKIGRAGQNLWLAAMHPGDASKYLSRDVNYEYDANNNRIDNYKMDSSLMNTPNGFDEFMRGQMLSTSKEQSISISGSLDVFGRDGARVSNPVFSASGANIGLNIWGSK